MEEEGLKGQKWEMDVGDDNGFYGIVHTMLRISGEPLSLTQCGDRIDKMEVCGGRFWVRARV